MPRLRQVPRAEASDAVTIEHYNRMFGPDRDPVAEPGTATGTSGNWWTVFALSPAVLTHATQGFQLYQGQILKLDPKLRELGQTRAGYLVGSQFVFSQHCKSCRGLGFPEAKIAGIAHWQSSDQFDERERTVLAYTDYLITQLGRVPDGVFKKLQTYLSDEQILELSYITCMYAMHATMSRALRLEFDDRDEPVVEIAAPETFAGRDFLDSGSR